MKRKQKKQFDGRPTVVVAIKVWRRGKIASQVQELIDYAATQGYRLQEDRTRGFGQFGHLVFTQEER